MQNYEYKVVPAPKRGLKGKGIKGTDARFANAMMTVMNELGAEGWEYQRSDTLPCEERTGLRGRSTTFQNMLVFRREVLVEAEDIKAAPAEPLIQTHAPLLNGTKDQPQSTAPALGPALDHTTAETVEVKDPRTDGAPQ
ncbi:DUF4177 domain-containing protein [Profundibacter sp.]